jgi:YbgC/YbaW family acyl-CoA thioester hydrolase
MPLTHERTFRVRHYECGLQKLARGAVYLRYTQETALDATAAAGYDEARYRAMNRLWLIRESRLDFHRPLQVGEKMQVTTWVADFRRVRSRRAYELRHSPSGELVGQGYSDWAFLELTTGRPAPIPPELIAAFFPGEIAAVGQPRDRFPAVEMAETDMFSASRRVEWRDLDGAGHVNNAVYLDYIDDNLRQILAARGWLLSRLDAEKIALTLRRLRIEYREPAWPEDRLLVALGLLETSPTGIQGYATITRVADGARLAQALVTWAGIGPDTGHWIDLPGALIADLTPRDASKPDARCTPVADRKASVASLGGS